MNYVNMIYNIYICLLGTTITTHDFYNINEVVIDFPLAIIAMLSIDKEEKSECVLFMDIRTLN